MWLKEYYEVLGAATKKAQAYTDQEVSKVRTKFAVVASYADLPNPGRTDTIYLVPKAGFVSVYDQYIYENNQYTDIGDTELDLDSYATDLELSQGLATKVDKVEGYGLSKNDFTDAKDTKLANIEDGAQKNVAPDSELDKTSTNAIQNKAVTEKFEEVEAEILNEDKVAEGNPITIKTGTAQVVKSTELSMLPVQDLHGYSKPWIGGSGKNLLQLNSSQTIYTETLYGIQVPAVEENVSYYIMANVSGFAAGTYTVNDYAGGGSSSTHRLRIYKNSESIGYASESKFTFTIDNVTDTISIRLYLYTGNTTYLLKPQMELGSDTTSYEPYANICPISGRTQSEIATQGINLWDEVTELGIINQTTGQNQNADNQIRSKNYTAIQPNTKYCFLCKGARISQIFWYDKNNTYLSYMQNTTDSAFITTSPANAYYVRFQFPMAYGTTYQNDGGVNYPSSYTDYSAHTEQKITISLGQTVYGGTLNVETGELTIEWASATIDGASVSSVNSSSGTDSMGGKRIDTNISGAYYAGSGSGDIAKIVADSLETVSSTAIFNGNPQPNTVSISGANVVVLRYKGINTKADAETEFTNNPIQVCYKLATPQTITLTPAQVNLLKGLNNISTDADKIKMIYSILNLQSDWNEEDPSADDYIKNKPDLSVYAEKDKLWDDATLTGNPVTIKTQSTQVAKQTILTMAPIQSGSGTPAPDNVRPISGRTQAEIVIKDENNVTQSTVTINLGSTIYGGSLDVETGVLTVNMGVIDLGDESLTWTRNATSGAFLANNLSPAAATWWGTSQIPNVVCEQYAAAKWNTISSDNDGLCGAYDVSLRISDTRYETVSAFKTGVAGVKLYYELATPVTATLTAGQVALIKGINNISTDADSITLTYFNDGESLTDVSNQITNVTGDLAPVESTTASTNYAIGDYMIFDGKFCKASSAITAGGTLEIGTNLTETTIAAELLSIISQLPTT